MGSASPRDGIVGYVSLSYLHQWVYKPTTLRQSYPIPLNIWKLADITQYWTEDSIHYLGMEHSNTKIEASRKIDAEECSTVLVFKGKYKTPVQFYCMFLFGRTNTKSFEWLIDVHSQQWQIMTLFKNVHLHPWSPPSPRPPTKKIRRIQMRTLKQKFIFDFMAAAKKNRLYMNKTGRF